MGIETFALAAIGIGAGTQILGSIASGNEQARAQKLRSQQLSVEAEQLRIRALQEETARRDELAQNVAVIKSIRGARNVGNSPTGFASLQKLSSDAASDIATARLSTLLGAEGYSTAASLAKRQATSARVGGYLGALSAAGTAGFRAYSLFDTVDASNSNQTQKVA